MTGRPPSKRKRDARDPAVARAVQGLDQVDVVGRERVVQGDAQVLPDGVVEGGHRPRRAQVAVEGLVGPVLGDVGDRVAVVAGLHALDAPLLGDGLVGGARRGGEEREPGVAGVGGERLLRRPSRCSRSCRPPCRTARPVCGWCRSPPDRHPPPAPRCKAPRAPTPATASRAPWRPRRAGRHRPPPPGPSRRRRPRAGVSPPRRAGWGGLRAQGTPPRVAGTGRRGGGRARSRRSGGT